MQVRMKTEANAATGNLAKFLDCLSRSPLEEWGHSSAVASREYRKIWLAGAARLERQIK
jgi:hypothetical protein